MGQSVGKQDKVGGRSQTRREKKEEDGGLEDQEEEVATTQDVGTFPLGETALRAPGYVESNIRLSD